MFFRLLFFVLIGYGVYRLFKSAWTGDTKKSEVSGRGRTKPLDLDSSQVEDARYEEIDEEKT